MSSVFGAASAGMKRPLEALIQDALRAAIAAGDLRVHDAPACVVEDPERAAFGDATCRVALSIARPLGRPAIEIARTIVRHVRDPHGWIEHVDAAGPGCINLRATPAFWQAALARVLSDAPPDERPSAGRAAVVAVADGDDAVALRTALVAGAVARLLARSGWDTARVEVRTGDAAAFMAAAGPSVGRCVVVGAPVAGGLARRAKRLRAEAGGDPTTTTIVAVRPVVATRSGRRLGVEGLRAALRTDAARFAVLGAAPDEESVLDVEQVRAERIDNPLFAVRYALARIARAKVPPPLESDLARLGPVERECLRLVARHHDTASDAARRAEPHRVVTHVRAVATAFHRYYNRTAPHDGSPGDVAARGAMLDGIGRVLRDGLALAGVRVAEGG